MTDRSSHRKMVLFGNSLFRTQRRKKRHVEQISGRLNQTFQKSPPDYGTLAQPKPPEPVTLMVTHHEVSCQTDPRLLAPLEEGEGYDESSSLTADINDIVYSFRSVTTIHGVQHAAAARNRSFRRRLWAVLVTLMAIFLTWFLAQQLTALSEHQISTTTTFDLKESMEFPAVTICNLNQYNKNRVPNDTTIRTVIFYMSEYSRVARELDPDIEEPDLSSLHDVSGEELLQVATEAAPTMEEFLLQCRWKGSGYNCSELFHATQTPQGRCYTFDMLLNHPLVTARVGEWAGLEVMLDIQQADSYYSEELQAGIKLVVHRSGDNAFPKRYGWHVRPGVFASVALTQHNRRGLPRPYKAYKNRYCEDTKSPIFANPLRRYSRYTAANCLEECAIDRMVNLCGCRAFNDAGNDTICSAQQMLMCYIPNRHRSAPLQVENDTTGLDNCNCSEECDTVIYTAALSYADFSSDFEELQLSKAKVYPNVSNLRRSFINLRIFFETMSVDTLLQEPAVNLLDILGTVGGQMGIFLGCSILSIVELLEMGLLISIRCSYEIFSSFFRSTQSKGTSFAKRTSEVPSPLSRKASDVSAIGGRGSQDMHSRINQACQAKPLMTDPE